MGRKINRRDKDLGWFSSHTDMENPGRLKAKQSSNMVFIGSALLIGFIAIMYVQLMNHNMDLGRQIREHEDYISNEHNKQVYEWRMLLQQRSQQLINYRDGAEKFLEQLKNADRVSEAGFRYYEAALKESTSQQASITNFSMSGNIVTINGNVPEEDMPRIFAEYLTNEKDEEGDPRFASVQYTGFSQGSGGYNFQVTITLWNEIK